MRSDILASDTCLIFFYNNWTRALAMAAVAVGPQQALASHGTRRHAWSVRLMGRRAPVRSLPPALAAGRHCTVVVAHVTAGMHAGYVWRRAWP